MKPYVYCSNPERLVTQLHILMSRGLSQTETLVATRKCMLSTEGSLDPRPHASYSSPSGLIILQLFLAQAKVMSNRELACVSVRSSAVKHASE
jgi:hypothetical protein